MFAVLSYIVYINARVGKYNKVIEGSSCVGIKSMSKAVLRTSPELCYAVIGCCYGYIIKHMITL